MSDCGVVISESSGPEILSGTEVNRLVAGVLSPVTPNQSPNVITSAVSFIAQSSRKILRRMWRAKSVRGLFAFISIAHGKWASRKYLPQRHREILMSQQLLHRPPTLNFMHPKGY